MTVAAAQGDDEQEFDNPLVFQYKIDDGPWLTAGGFRGLHSNSPSYVFEGGHFGVSSGVVPESTDPRLTRTFRDWEFRIFGTGSTMQFRVFVNANGGLEEYGFDNIRISGDNSLTFFTLSLNSAGFLETDGGGAGVLTITALGGAPGSDVVFALEESDTDNSEAALPAEITLPAGQSTVGVPFDILADGRFDGDEPVTIQVSAPGWAREQITFTVTNVDPKPNVVVNEFYPDPFNFFAPTDLQGDSNNDGVRNDDEDEFMEIVNLEAFPVDISSWELWDERGPRHIFPDGTVLGAGQAAVVFGGGDPHGIFGGSKVDTSSQGNFSFGVTGENVSLRAGGANAAGAFVDNFTYPPELGGTMHSITRNPDGTGGFVDHATVAPGGAFFSPGTKSDGTPFFTFADTLSIAFDSGTVAEDAADLGGTVSLTNPAPAGGLLVSLLAEGDNADELILPATVTIPEGATEIGFTAQPVNDGVLDGDREVTIRATADNMFPALAYLTTTEVEPNPFNVVINETLGSILGSSLDANGNGIFEEPVEDQFIEIVNNGDFNVDLTGWTVRLARTDEPDPELLVHTFPSGTLLAPQGAIVIFGGGDEAALQAASDALFGGAIVQVANSSFNGVNLTDNGDGRISLLTPNGFVVDRVEYSIVMSNANQSLVRDPDLTGDFGALHFEVSPAFAVASTGRQLDGAPFPVNNEAGFLLFQESFETDGADTRYTVENPSDDGFFDYFARRREGSGGTRTSGGPIDGEFFWTGRDIDADGAAVNDLASDEGRITFNQFDISGVGRLQITLSAAQGVDQTEFDNGLFIQVKIDNGDFQTIGGFRGTFTNSPARYFQGGDDTLPDHNVEPRLTQTFKEFSWEVPGAGDTMQIRIKMNLNGGNEELAFDNLRVTADDAVEGFTLSIDNPVVSETAGASAATVTVTLNNPAPAGGASLDISLVSALAVGGPDSEISVPATVEIAESATVGMFLVDAVADGRFDGDVETRIFVGGNGFNKDFIPITTTNVDDPPNIVLNEFLVGVGSLPEDLVGDANGDGIRSNTEDEFVEIVNISGDGTAVDFSGWLITDEIGPRHTFPAGTVIEDGRAIVVFGGGIPTGLFGGATVQTASQGNLGWSSSGDTIAVVAGGVLVTSFTYAGDLGTASIAAVRDPELTGDFVLHDVATDSGGALFSPGTQTDGSTPFGDFNFAAALELSANIVSESAGAGAVTATITLDNAAPAGGLQVNIESTGAPDRIDFSGPGVVVSEILDEVLGTTVRVVSLTIAEGSTQGTFDIDIIDDGVLGGDRDWPIIVKEPKPVPGLAILTVTESETNPFTVVINELLQSPVGTGLDPNGDGIPEQGLEDQFIEIVNASGMQVDISGWTLRTIGQGVFGVNTLTIVHEFPDGTVVADQGSVVVFGGGDEAAMNDPANDAYGGAIVQIANQESNGVNLASDKDTIVLLVNEHGFEMDEVSYSVEDANQAQSLTRSPDLTGGFPSLHFDVSPVFLLFSPGADTAGMPFPGNGPFSNPVLVVNSTADPGDGVCDATECTLREAIDAANANAGLDTIEFDIPGDGPHTIQPDLEAGGVPVGVMVHFEFTWTPNPILPGNGSFNCRFDWEGGGFDSVGDEINEPDVTEWAFDAFKIGTGPSSSLGLGRNAEVWIDDVSYTVGSGATGPAGTRTESFDSGLGTLFTEIRSLTTEDSNLRWENTNRAGVAPGEFGGIFNRTADAGAHLIADLGIGDVSRLDELSISGNFFIVANNDFDGWIEIGFTNLAQTDQNPISEFQPFLGIALIEPIGEDVNFRAIGLSNTISGGRSRGSQPASAFPEITDAVVIDGYTQPGAAASTASTPATLKIELNGTNAGGSAIGLDITAGSSTVKGLVVNGFASHYGIRLAVNGSNRIGGNYIGTDVTGTVAQGNNSGLGIESSDLNIIGGTTPAERNIISGNVRDGVVIVGTGTNNNLIKGNYIGTDVTGARAMGNYTGVVILSGAQSNTVGGSTDGERNIISGNNGSGVAIDQSGTDNNVVKGNFIGTDVSGTEPLGNSVYGVSIAVSAQSNIVGGTTAGERNIISGNDVGVVISFSGTNNNVVSGNYIGTDVSGTTDLGNSNFGVWLADTAQSNTIGGTTAGERNIISGNGSHGVVIVGNGTDSNLIKGNFIGTDVSGTAPLGNTFDGIIVADGARSNIIGGESTGERNIISANGGGGVNLHGVGTNNNTVSGNYIGTDVTGTADLGNSSWGIRFADGASSNTIGGTIAGERNIISGNDNDGVVIEDPGTDNNVVKGNFIGTDVSGTEPLGNTQFGLIIAEGARSNIIGGTTAGERNIISGNNSEGVVIFDPGTNNNVVSGNYIGTDVSGMTDLGNSGFGVFMAGGGRWNVIGGTTPGERNIISGNYSGVAIAGIGTDNNLIRGNFLGTDVTGATEMGNSENGVSINGGAQSNIIGGTTVGERNIISGNRNGHSGVLISGEGTGNNVVSGNYIGTDVNGTTAMGNSQGIAIVAGAQSNTIGGTTVGERNIISANDTHGVLISGIGTDNNLIKGNYVGTDVTGTADLGNSVNGVRIDGGAQSNIIGGTTAGERNIISGNRNGHSGLVIAGEGTGNNVVSGNYIGTDVNGTTSISNSQGVSIVVGTQSNTIGGTTVGERNIISGNDTHGVLIADPGTDNNVVKGNFIGTNVTGAADLGNSLWGIRIAQGAHSNTIGGPQPGEGNVIAFNNSNGVLVGTSLNDTSRANSIRGNAIFSNALLGIDLGSEGVTANDSLDLDTGPNNLQNFPEISFSTVGSTRIVGTLHSIANEEFTLDFYASSEVDGSGFGEGKRYLGSVAAMTDGSGDASFDVTLQEEVVVGEFITATATDSSDNTSEFSPGVAALFELPVETVVVVNTNDSGAGSLREAIEVANADVRPAIIKFDIPGEGPHTIQPGSQLPWITDSVIIDGYTESGAIPNTNPLGFGSNAVLKIELDGSLAGMASGLTIVAADCTVQGLVINRFGGLAGIEINAIGNVVRGNFIGTDTSGSAGYGMGNFPFLVAGILVRLGQNTIGGLDAGARNIISGNDSSGIVISGPNNSGNLVQGNFVGIDASGSSGLGNSGNGVLLLRADDNNVGGTEAGAGNVISSNGSGGIRNDNGDGNLVQGNYIGTNVSGTADLGNASNGVKIAGFPFGAINNTIGGSQPGAGNIISGNEGIGISIEGSGAFGNMVQGNFIGTDVTGTLDFGNSFEGVEVKGGAQSNIIGGSTAGDRNIISGNGSHGVAIGDTGTKSNLVRGNFIGTNVNGTAGLGNSENGVLLSDGAQSNTIGGSKAGARNIISANDSTGVMIQNSGTDNNVVRGNYIGSDVNGTGNIGNAFSGVIVHDDASMNSIRGNSIFANLSLGIDLGWDGVTPNDSDDADSGPNNLQNYPVISLFETGATRVAGNLNSLPDSIFEIDFFANASADPSGFGEGERFLGTTTVTTDSFGDTSFDLAISVATTAGEFVTATATDPNGSTSEFSASIEGVLSGVALTFEDWKSGTFDPDDLGNEAIVGTLADPDQDGIPNLLEFARSLDPLSPDISMGTVPEVTTEGDFLTITFSRVSNLTDVRYALEVSDDLVNWEIVDLVGRILVVDNSVQTVEVRLPTESATRKFIRLKVTEN